MSEVAKSIKGFFERARAGEVSNELVNTLIKETIHEAISRQKQQNHNTRDEFVRAVAESVYDILGLGAICTTIETEIEKFPDKFVAHQNKSETVFKHVYRTDFPSFVHTAVLSPTILLKDDETSEELVIGTDKLGHLIQQGFDYLRIYEYVEQNYKKGYGKLFSHAWGVWTEGAVITASEIIEFQRKQGQIITDEVAENLLADIKKFIDEAPIILDLNPTPKGLLGISPLRWTAHHILGLHEMGIFGFKSTGIFSYADLCANLSGLEFFLDLMTNPEAMANHFDITTYLHPDWDEEINPSLFHEKLQKKMDMACQNKTPSPFISGLGISYKTDNSMLSCSYPFYYIADDHDELIARVGVSAPGTFSSQKLKEDTSVFAALDFSRRITGLSALYMSGEIGLNLLNSTNKKKGIFSPAIEVGYESRLNNLSVRVGASYNINAGSFSLNIGLLSLF